MKKWMAFVLALVCAVSFAGCSSAQNTLGEVTLESEIVGTQIADIRIETNTTKISVTADDLSGDTEVSLFLYYAEDLNNPILYALLTAQDKSVDFSNLTSACTYQLGAEIKNAVQSVTLKITD